MRPIGLCALLVLVGCSLNRGGPPEQHYVLGGGERQEGSAGPAALADVAVGIRRLQLAGYLESNSIVVRGGGRAQELSLSEFHRWSEPLAGGINRAVAGDLRAAAHFQVVEVAPWSARSQHDFLIELEVLRFEGVAPAGAAAAEGEAHLLATWTIVRPDDGEVLARGTTEYREGGWRIGDYAGLVALLDAGVSTLSLDLLRSLGSLASSERALLAQ